MNLTTALVLPLLIGMIAGLRAMTAPAAVSWAARAGWLTLAETPLAFLGYAFTPWIFTVLALGELVTDQLPTTPSRTVPIQFGTRILMGASIGRRDRGCRGAHWRSGLIAGIDRRGDRHARRPRRARGGWRPRSAAIVPRPLSRTPSPSAARS